MSHPATCRASAWPRIWRTPSSTWVNWGIVGFLFFTAGLAFARGAVRQIVGVATLAISVGVAWYVFRHRVQIFGATGMGMSTDRLLMLSAAAGLLTYFLCKLGMYLLATLGFLKILGGMAGWKGVMMSFIPSGALLWIASMVLRVMYSPLLIGSPLRMLANRALCSS